MANKLESEYKHLAVLYIMIAVIDIAFCKLLQFALIVLIDFVHHDVQCDVFCFENANDNS